MRVIWLDHKNSNVEQNINIIKANVVVMTAGRPQFFIQPKDRNEKELNLILNIMAIKKEKIRPKFDIM